ncbi:MAG: hypothetical protein OHK0052_26090 [Anaerolineales bacterium]
MFKKGLFKSVWGRALVLALALAVVVVGVVLAADVSIDNFSNRTQNLIYTVDGSEPNQMTNFNTSTSAIGGHRDVILDILSGDLDQTSQCIASQSNQYVALANGANVASICIVQWDGTDDTVAVDDEGLSSLNVVDTSNTGFLARVTNSDGLAVDITIRAYEDGSADWVEQTLPIKSTVSSGNVVDVFFPFTGFAGGTGAGTVSFTNLGAVTLSMDATTEPGADITIKYLVATNASDYGDLPTTYGTGNFASERLAFHVPQGLRLGLNVDSEAANQNSNATGDNTNGSNDEDGVAVTSGENWSDGANGGHIDYVVNGCNSAPCRLNGWIDFNSDGDFTDAGEHIINDLAVSNGGTTSYDFTTSGFSNNTSYYARFRICPTTGLCNTPTASNVLNGEIEDYLWAFGPNAVTLNDLSATSSTPWMAVALGAGLLVTLAAGALLLRRKLA